MRHNWHKSGRLQGARDTGAISNAQITSAAGADFVQHLEPTRGQRSGEPRTWASASVCQQEENAQRIPRVSAGSGGIILAIGTLLGCSGGVLDHSTSKGGSAGQAGNPGVTSPQLLTEVFPLRPEDSPQTQLVFSHLTIAAVDDDADGLADRLTGTGDGGVIVSHGDYGTSPGVTLTLSGTPDRSPPALNLPNAPLNPMDVLSITSSEALQTATLALTGTKSIPLAGMADLAWQTSFSVPEVLPFGGTWTVSGTSAIFHLKRTSATAKTVSARLVGLRTAGGTTQPSDRASPVDGRGRSQAGVSAESCTSVAPLSCTLRACSSSGC